ncbi:MAG: hypothetical protein WBM04_01175 [Candidatus Korobacteraceae bacterium]
MPTTSKSTKKTTPAAAAGKPEFADAFTPLYVNGVERLAELQKKSLDIAVEQSTEFLNTWKKAFSFFPLTSATFVFDIAEQAVETFVETQKSAIDFAVEQSHTIAGINNTRVKAYGDIANRVTGAFQQSVERSVEAQKKVLDFASAQNKTVFEAAKKQLAPVGAPVAAVVDSFQRGTEAFIETQKAALEIAAKPFKSAAAR